jgi:fibrillarin-like pre-rRNA processing protein
MEQRSQRVEPAEAQEIYEGVFRVVDPKEPRRKLLATMNVTPGRSLYGERLVLARIAGKNVEFRLWDPFRSKLSAAVLKGMQFFPFRKGSTCLYVGASTGTTVSHVSDILGISGKIFAVEISSRVAREFLQNVVKYRQNIVPIIADARQPERYSSIYGKVDSIYFDIAQPDQTEIAISNCEMYLREESKEGRESPSGTLVLVIKASSIDALKPKKEVFAKQSETLRKSGFEILEQIDLQPYDKNHAIIVARRR